MYISRIDSMTEALISEVFKRPVLWDHRMKGYHNRDLTDSEWMNLSQTLEISSKYYYIAFLFGLYTILSTDMISSDYIMMALNYRAPRIASSCHSTEPAGLLKYSQNRSRVCLALAVTELCILVFFN